MIKKDGMQYPDCGLEEFEKKNCPWLTDADRYLMSLVPTNVFELSFQSRDSIELIKDKKFNQWPEGMDELQNKVRGGRKWITNDEGHDWASFMDDSEYNRANSDHAARFSTFGETRPQKKK